MGRGGWGLGGAGVGGGGLGVGGGGLGLGGAGEGGGGLGLGGAGEGGGGMGLGGAGEGGGGELQRSGQRALLGLQCSRGLSAGTWQQEQPEHEVRHPLSKCALRRALLPTVHWPSPRHGRRGKSARASSRVATVACHQPDHCHLVLQSEGMYGWNQK